MLTLTLMNPTTATAQQVSDASIVAAADSIAARAVARGVVPTLGLAITRRGRVLLTRGYGMADATRGIRANERTYWYLASTSKSFTGFAVSLMAERGELRFDAPITESVPHARWHPDARPESLTLSRFLSHTHHLDNTPVVVSAAFSGAQPEARWPELLRHAAPTGSQDLSYNNLSYNVAAMAIDARHKEGWRAWIEREVFHPAGMHDTHARVSGLDPARIALPHVMTGDGSFVSVRFEKADATMNSAGGHLATLNDLARWTLVQMDSGMIDGKRVFPASAVQRSHSLIAKHTQERARTFAYFAREGWGAGWDLGTYEGERMVSRFGGYHTTRSHLGFLPGRRIGVVALTPGGAGGVTDILAALVYDLDAGRADAMTKANTRLDALIGQLPALRARAAQQEADRVRRRALPITTPGAFAGVFRNEVLGDITIERRGAGLTYRWGVLSGELEPDDPASGRFRLPFAGNSGVLAFTLNAGSGATAFTFQDVTFTRVAP
jgi:CubicO group peptidase (beta-lactamase class C family)